MSKKKTENTNQTKFKDMSKTSGQEPAKEKSLKEVEKNINKTFREIFPVADYNDKDKCFVLKDGTLMDIVQLKTRDINNASEDEIKIDILRFTKMYRQIENDLKIIAMNFPCDTRNQLKYFRHKRETCRNVDYMYWLDIKIQELEIVQKTTTSREFYMVIYAKNRDELDKTFINMRNALGSKGGFMIILSKDKKNLIIEKLNNKCMI